MFVKYLLQIRNDLVKVHYTGWSTKYDEWIPAFSERIIKQCI